MYAIHFGFLFQNLNVTFFFLSSHMYDKKKKLQHIFQLFQDKKKKERNDFVQSFFLAFIHILLFSRGLELRHVSSGILPTTFCCA